MSLFNIKHWGYWPSYMFYIPNIPYAIYLAFKAKNIVFFSATNPAIKHSGNGSESKFSTIELIPSTYKPATVYIKANDAVNTSIKKIAQQKIKYPLIIKPDIGFRGLLVEKINSDVALKNYLEKHHKFNLIAQEYISFKNECGIFYYRLPNSTIGNITSITLKKYLTVIGDGKSTVKELIATNNRAQLYLPLLEKIQKENFNIIIPKGEEFLLNSIGNHSKGTQFINGNHLINKKLINTIDTIFKKIPNLYYGRIDLKHHSIEDLLALKNFKIIEINGIISEPTHIYDPNNMSYFKALKEIRKHWKIMYKIATINHKLYNVKYDSLSGFLKSLKNLRNYTQQIKAESNSTNS